MRRKSQRKRKRKFLHAFSHELALPFALSHMSICVRYLLHLRPRFSSCLFETCLCLNLRWFVSVVSKRECFVYFIFIYIVFASTHVRLCALALKVFIHSFQSFFFFQNLLTSAGFVPCKGIRIPQFGKTLLIMESGILCFGTRNTAQRIRNPTNDWNPEPKFH